MPHPTRSVAATLAVLLLGLGLSGCGNLPFMKREKDPTPPTELEKLLPSVTLSAAWSVRHTRGTQGQRLYLAPALAAGRLYIADHQGRLAAIAADSGRLLWERDTDHAFSAGPEIIGERLILGTSKGDLLAFTSSDGSEQWRASLNSEILSMPRATAGGQILVHTLDDSVAAVATATGQLLWRAVYPAPVLTLRGSSTPVITDDGVIVGLSGGKLVKLDAATGVPLWEVIVTRPSGRSELARIADIDADPVLMDGILYSATYNGDLAAVDASSGAVLWRRELSAHAGLAADPRGLVITDSSDQIWSADISDGAGRWKQEQLRYRRLTAPALIGNLIAVGDLEGYVHLLAHDDGRVVGRIRITKKGRITAPPLVADGRLYVLADDGTLVALRIGGLNAGQGTEASGASANPPPTAATPPPETP